jgi:hypothetical protein
MRTCVTAATALLAMAAACTAPATQVIVHVDAEPALRAATRSLELRVIGEGGTDTYDQTRVAGAFSWPATLPVAPSPGRNEGAFDVVATLELEGGNAVRATARTAFVADRRTHVWIMLDERCVGVECAGEARTCIDGACVDGCFEASDGVPLPPRACQLPDGGPRPDTGPGDDSGGPCLDGEACDAGAGTCRAGVCCTGCWSGTECITATSPAACGAGGIACSTCPCGGDLCDAGVCAPAADRVATTVATWYQHGCASSEERAWCWGFDDRGQVGDGIPTGRRPPTYVGAVGAIHLNGPFHTCSSSLGDRWCWGANDSDGLGIAGAPSMQTVPRQAVDDTRSWSDVRTGQSFGCALSTPDQEVWCWGTNSGGQIAQPSTVASSSTPLRVARADATIGRYGSFDVGLSSAIAITSDGALEGWGGNRFGELARDPATGTAVRAPIAIAIPGGDPVRSASIGQYHACAITTEGELYCWGEPGLRLGPRSGGPTWVPERVEHPIAGRTWAAISAGSDHTCAIDDAHQAWCWGVDDWSQLGDLAGGSSAVPVAVDASETDRSGWSVITTGGEGTCGITMRGAIHCWGHNREGVLGLTPLLVPSPTRLCLPAPE